MLADTDVGRAITAAESGVQWGYTMILPQVILRPILFMVHEMTVRLGIVTQKGHGEAIREQFGLGWGVVSVSALFLAWIGALVTEFSGIAIFLADLGTRCRTYILGRHPPNQHVYWSAGASRGKLPGYVRSITPSEVALYIRLVLNSPDVVIKGETGWLAILETRAADGL